MRTTHPKEKVPFNEWMEYIYKQLREYKKC